MLYLLHIHLVQLIAQLHIFPLHVSPLPPLSSLLATLSNTLFHCWCTNGLDVGALLFKHCITIYFHCFGFQLPSLEASNAKYARPQSTSSARTISPTVRGWVHLRVAKSVFWFTSSFYSKLRQRTQQSLLHVSKPVYKLINLEYMLYNSILRVCHDLWPVAICTRLVLTKPFCSRVQSNQSYLDAPTTQD